MMNFDIEEENISVYQSEKSDFLNTKAKINEESYKENFDFSLKNPQEETLTNTEMLKIGNFINESEIDFKRKFEMKEIWQMENPKEKSVINLSKNSSNFEDFIEKIPKNLHPSTKKNKKNKVYDNDESLICDLLNTKKIQISSKKEKNAFENKNLKQINSPLENTNNPINIQNKNSLSNTNFKNFIENFPKNKKNLEEEKTQKILQISKEPENEEKKFNFIKKSPKKEESKKENLIKNRARFLKRNLKTKNLNYGLWTQEEHRKFVEGVIKFGNNWKKIQKNICTRNTAQARSHAQKFFIKIKKDFKLKKNIHFETLTLFNRFKDDFFLKEDKQIKEEIQTPKEKIYEIPLKTNESQIFPQDQNKMNQNQRENLLLDSVEKNHQNFDKAFYSIFQPDSHNNNFQDFYCETEEFLYNKKPEKIQKEENFNFFMENSLFKKEEKNSINNEHRNFSLENIQKAKEIFFHYLMNLNLNKNDSGLKENFSKEIIEIIIKEFIFVKENKKIKRNLKKKIFKENERNQNEDDILTEEKKLKKLNKEIHPIKNPFENNNINSNKIFLNDEIQKEFFTSRRKSENDFIRESNEVKKEEMPLKQSDTILIEENMLSKRKNSDNIFYFLSKNTINYNNSSTECSPDQQINILDNTSSSTNHKIQTKQNENKNKNEILENMFLGNKTKNTNVPSIKFTNENNNSEYDGLYAKDVYKLNFNNCKNQRNSFEEKRFFNERKFSNNTDIFFKDYNLNLNEDKRKYSKDSNNTSVKGKVPIFFDIKEKDEVKKIKKHSSLFEDLKCFFVKERKESQISNKNLKEKSPSVNTNNENENVLIEEFKNNHKKEEKPKKKKKSKEEKDLYKKPIFILKKSFHHERDLFKESDTSKKNQKKEKDSTQVNNLPIVPLANIHGKEDYAELDKIFSDRNSFDIFPQFNNIKNQSKVNQIKDYDPHFKDIHMKNEEFLEEKDNNPFSLNFNYDECLSDSKENKKRRENNDTCYNFEYPFFNKDFN